MHLTVKKLGLNFLSSTCTMKEGVWLQSPHVGEYILEVLACQQIKSGSNMQQLLRKKAILLVKIMCTQFHFCYRARAVGTGIALIIF